jgi:AcrR family transcriptional regulator
MTQQPSREPLSQDFIDGFKRERTALALSELVHELGLSKLTVSLITSRGKMARTTFYSLFESREAAVAYAIDLGHRRLRAAIERTVHPGRPPWERAKAVIDALLSVAETEPYLVELCLFHGRGGEEAAIPFEPDVVESLAGVLRAIPRHTHKPEPNPRAEEFVALGILALISERLSRGEAEGLRDLGPELTKVASLYLDPDAGA